MTTPKPTTKAEIMAYIGVCVTGPIGKEWPSTIRNLEELASRLPDEGPHEATEAMVEAGRGDGLATKHEAKRIYRAMERAPVAAPAEASAGTGAIGDTPSCSDCGAIMHRTDKGVECPMCGAYVRLTLTQSSPAAEREELPPNVSEADVDSFEHDLLHDFRIAADDAEQLRGFMRWLAGKVAWYSLRALREERWRRAQGETDED